VDIKADQDCGRKMWRCSRLLFTTSFMVVLMPSSSDFPVARILENRRLSIIDARQGMLKWFRGSKSIIAASWPPTLVEDRKLGNMAWAMIR
jgi:hypothetical protein